MFLDRCRLLREALDRPAITTDVIAGFPGETDEEFKQTLQTCRDAGFSKIHAFPFSARRGTPAAEMPEQVHKSLRSDRVRQLTELEGELRHAYYRELVGSQVELLIESAREVLTFDQLSTTPAAAAATQVVRGTTCRYAPSELEVPSSRTLTVGDLVPAIVVSTDGKKLTVEHLDSSTQD